jgi:hypothetical protein
VNATGCIDMRTWMSGTNLAGIAVRERSTNGGASHVTYAGDDVHMRGNPTVWY